MKAFFAGALIVAVFAIADAPSVRELPNPTLTPGAVRVTETEPMYPNCPAYYVVGKPMVPPANCPGPVTETEVCATRGTARFRHTMRVTKHRVCAEYGITDKAQCSAMEDDHDLSLELGGSDALPNHWPEPWNGAHGAHVKDHLENELRRLVCEQHAIKLEAAWRCITSNWILCAEQAAAGRYSEMGK